MLNKQIESLQIIVLLTSIALGGCASNSALISAAQTGDARNMQQLVHGGANVNMRTGYNRCDPAWSANNDEAEAVVSMVKNAGIDNSMTVLMMSTLKGHTDTVRVLLNQGADINARDYFGSTALIIAAENGHSEIVKLLLDKGADVNAKDNFGTTSLMAASGNAGTAKMLVEKHPDGKVSISLSMAVVQSGTEAVELLLKNGADVNAKDRYGGTALARAAYAGHTEAVRLLLRRNADVNTKRNDGCTPLMLAAEEDNSEIIRMLLGANADSKAQNKKGKTALDLAKSEEIRRMLRAAGV